VSEIKIDARYGRTKQRSRRTRLIAITFAVGIVVVFGAWAIWGGLDVPGASVESTDVGNVRVNSQAIEVRWELSENPGQKAKCAVQALDINFGIVGWKVITIPPSTTRSRTFSTVVRTAQPAVSGLIYLCWPT
jgi:hypothetical protein